LAHTWCYSNLLEVGDLFKGSSNSGMYFCGSFIGSVELELIGRKLVLVQGIIRVIIIYGGEESYYLEMSRK
jgi:hypothetical protein